MSKYGYENVRVYIKTLPKSKVISGVLMPIDLAIDVAKYHVIEETYWYWSEQSAANYITLNEESESGADYSWFNDSLRLMSDNASNIVDAAFQKFSDWVKTTTGKLPEIDFISLGAGDIKKESKILDSFLLEYKQRHRKTGLTFIFADISYRLIIKAIENINNKFQDEIDQKHLNTSPIVADFIQQKLFGKHNYKFITALGIVHNASIPNIFDTLKNHMTDKSILLIDAALTGSESDDEMKKSYESDEYRQFIYGPLKILNEASTGSGSIADDAAECDVALHTFQGYGMPDEGEIRTHIINDPDEIIRELKLPPDSREKLRISKYPNSKTIIAAYHPNDVGKTPIVLGYSTRFGLDDLTNALNENGFEIILQKRFNNTAYFLLTKNGQEGKPKNHESFVEQRISGA